MSREFAGSLTRRSMMLGLLAVQFPRLERTTLGQKPKSPRAF
jgi:hypothetical protein